jgi:hypothetical protein
VKALSKKKTVGEQAYNASLDEARYNVYDIAYALTDDIAKELQICAHRHTHIFGEEEYCVGYVLASDPLIKGVMRRKFFSYLYLPSPRPSQSVFLYNKIKDQFTKRLWTLPNAWSMACLSETATVDSKFKEMKHWCNAFFAGTFWETIRAQHGIKLLSETEYLNTHREELIKASGEQIQPSTPEAFDFSKITVNHVVDSNNALLSQNPFDRLWKT